jgi:hypothetical protein
MVLVSEIIMNADQLWRDRSDDEVLAASERLFEYTEDGERTIREELIRRGLHEPPAAIGSCPGCSRSISASHPGTSCLHCGAPLPAGIVQRLSASLEPSPEGIGGWLLVPALGLAIGPVAESLSLSRAWELRSQFVSAGLGRVYTLELLVDLGLFVFLLIAAARFFRKKRSAPATFLAFLSARLVVSAILLVIEWRAGLAAFAAAQVGNVLSAAAVAGLWGWYFTSSRRVKATFVN